jgi:hypothetical protein
VTPMGSQGTATAAQTTTTTCSLDGHSEEESEVRARCNVYCVHAYVSMLAVVLYMCSYNKHYCCF